MCSVCGAFDAPFAELLWPLVKEPTAARIIFFVSQCRMRRHRIAINRSSADDGAVTGVGATYTAGRRRTVKRRESSADIGRSAQRGMMISTIKC